MKVNELTPLLSDENIIYVSDPDRQLFIMKVYRTIWVELLYTVLFIYLAMNIKPINDFMTGNYGFGILFLVFNLLIIQSCSLICCMDKLRKKPYNYLYVSIYTILMSYFLFFLCYTVPPQSLLLAGTSTLFMFSGLSIYAWQTNIDYSTKGNYLLISLLLLFLLGFFNLLFQLTFIQILYPLLGVGGRQTKEVSNFGESGLRFVARVPKKLKFETLLSLSHQSKQTEQGEKLGSAPNVVVPVQVVL